MLKIKIHIIIFNLSYHSKVNIFIDFIYKFLRIKVK